MFGRRKRQLGDNAAADDDYADGDEVGTEPGPEGLGPDGQGPYDGDVAPEDGCTRLDLGSVLLPVPDGAQLQVEMDRSGPVRAVHLITETGQLTVTPFAAPKTGGLWNEVADELVDQLRGDGARVSEFDGEWGREIAAVTSQAVLRFVAVDGPRWMLRGVAAGPAQQAEPLADQLHELVRHTVVVRGTGPLPVRSPLPLQLPEPLAEQLQQATENG